MRKTSGEDGIYNEVLKQAAEHIIQKIATIVIKILYTEKIPDQWETITIILLHKNSTKDDLNNYRP